MIELNPVSSSLRPHARKNRFLGIVALVFIVAISYLLWRIQVIDDEHRKSAMAQFSSDAVRMAGNIHHFLQERHIDMEYLGEGRTIQSYFENLALGMSSQYGLMASSLEVESLFANVLAGRRIGGKAVFEALTLQNEKGEVVAHSSDSSPGVHGGYIPASELWPESTQVHDDGFLWAVIDAPKPANPRLIMAHPLTHAGKKAGSLLVRISIQALLWRVFSDEMVDGERVWLVRFDGNRLYSRFGEEAGLIEIFKTVGNSPRRIDTDKNILGKLIDKDGAVFAVAAGVLDSGLSVIALTPEDSLVGSSTWHLSMLVAALSLTVLIGFTFAIRSHAERLLLSARFEDQARSAEQVRKRMDEFNTLFDELPGQAWYMNAEGRIIAANAAVCELLGRVADDVIGKTMHNVFPQVAADELARLESSLLSGQNRTLDIEQIYERDGRSWVISNRLVSIVHAEGKVGGIIGLGFDVTEKRRVEEELKRSSSFQVVIMELAIGFVNTPIQKLDQAILKALAMIGEFATVDRAYLFSYDFKAGTMSNTHEWCASGIKPEQDNLQMVPNELFPEWVEAHRRKELVHIPSVEALPENDNLRIILESQNIRTLITLPLVHGDSCFGFVGFDAVGRQKKWTKAEISLLAVMAELLTNAEMRRLHERHLLKAKAAAEEAFAEVEVKVRKRTRELAETNVQLQGEISERIRAIRSLNLVLGSISAVLIVVDRDWNVSRWSPMAESVFGLNSSDVEGQDFRQMEIAWDRDIVLESIKSCRLLGKRSPAATVRFHQSGGNEGFLMLTVSPIYDESELLTGFLLLGEDITEVRFLEARLAQAAKLEAIGQLAAGIAHEINTPAQYVGDSVTFLQEVYDDFRRILASLETVLGQGSPNAEAFSTVYSILQEGDMEFIASEIPRTFERIFDGMRRINNIVQAMNRFSYSHSCEKKLMNVNEIIRNTLIITSNEWKYVADVETDLDPELDEVIGFADEMGQVFLNVIINATHAVSDVVHGTSTKGFIGITTRRAGDYVEIRIRDTGTGISEENRGKVFNLFFTTKDVGRGSGQGLAIAYDIVVNKHGGLITFDSEPGQGTTFIIKLPKNDSLISEMSETAAL